MPWDNAKAATFFPQPIGLAATWDTDFMEAVAGIISEEMRAINNEQYRLDKTHRYCIARCLQSRCCFCSGVPAKSRCLYAQNGWTAFAENMTSNASCISMTTCSKLSHAEYGHSAFCILSSCPTLSKHNSQLNDLLQHTIHACQCKAFSTSGHDQWEARKPVDCTSFASILVVFQHFRQIALLLTLA